MPGVIESRKCTVDGQRVHYLETGNGPPVVLLHGGASDSTDWIATLGILSANYSLYAPDMVGYGQSDRVKQAYHLRDFVASTRDFIQGLGLGSPALVGHSLGGRVCLDIALLYPEMVSKLVLIDTMGFSRISRWGNWLGTGLWRIRKFLGQPNPYPAMLPGEGEDPHWICLNRLPNLLVPTLVVWKRLDPYLPLASARKARELMPEASLKVFPGYGHAPHRQNRRAFHRLLMSFLNGEQPAV